MLFGFKPVFKDPPYNNSMALPLQNVLGLNWVDTDFPTWIERFLTCLNTAGGGIVVTPNPEIVMRARSDQNLKRLLGTADFCLPDGVGIVWASRLLGQPLTQRLAGSDTVEALLSRFDGAVFLWGAKPGVAEAAAARLKVQHPQFQGVGTASGYYDPATEPDIIEAIQASGARLVLVAMGTPKQEQVMSRLRQSDPDLWMIGVGGMLDVLSGQLRRAPTLWQHLGLEWLYRGLQQPARVGRWWTLAQFVMWVLKQKMTGQEQTV